MRNDSKQTQAWSSEFGVEYTDRNMMTVDEMEALNVRKYGIRRTDMNVEFIDSLDRNIRVLEVGCNIGNQLLCLQRLGFKNLYGVDVSEYALEIAKARAKGITLFWGSALDLPFKDRFFDMVFTSGMLIHINPHQLHEAMCEIHRCSKRYIWGLEYFAEERTQIKYRHAKETDDLLWKADFPKIYCEQCSDLRAVKVKCYKYLDDNNEDVMFLLEKRA